MLNTNFLKCQYDTDGSGQIEFPEFCNMMSHKMNITDDVEMVRLAFRTLDKDGSGFISTTEFKHLMTHIGEDKSPLSLNVLNIMSSFVCQNPT